MFVFAAAQHSDTLTRRHAQFTLPALGKLKSLRVWHDNHGAGSAWHLHRIRVVDKTAEVTTVFVCNQWLQKKDGEDTTSLVLYPEAAVGKPSLANIQAMRTKSIDYKVWRRLCFGNSFLR